MTTLALSSPFKATPYAPFHKAPPTVRFSGLPDAFSISRHDANHALTHGAVALVAGTAAGTMFGPEIHHLADMAGDAMTHLGPSAQYIAKRGTEIVCECLAPITGAMQAFRKATGKAITKKTLAHDLTVCAVPTVLTHVGVDAAHGFDMAHTAHNHVAEHAHTLIERCKEALTHTTLYCALPGVVTDTAKATHAGKKVIKRAQSKMSSLRQKARGIIKGTQSKKRA